MKIQNISINKYKAFKSTENIPVNGNNIFIYGENGSGKSSFYYALKDFFQSSVEDIKMADLRNIYLEDDSNDCSIEVEFDGELKHILNETTKNTNTVEITDANRLKSFLTYKHLLGVHNVKLKTKINVFELIIEGVLKHFKSNTITGGIELGKLWENVLSESQKPFGKGHDFYFARQKKASVEHKANAFNQAINKLFLPDNADYIGTDVNNILVKIFPELSLTFQRQTITVNQWGNISEARILINIQSNGTSLEEQPVQFVLNEAKLSAIAISIFLGVIKRQSRFTGALKPLFLDDILIGLDNEYRLKLLDVLKEDFSEFQIFLTTYDRNWYEVAKLNLSGWSFIEFYKGNGKPKLIHNQQNNIERATTYFEAFDFPASANYLRKECEAVLKDKLLATYVVGDGIKGLVKPPKLETLIDRLKSYYEDLGLEPPNVLINNLQSYKSILFNPMSHNDVDSPIYKNDLETAFKVIEDLSNLKLPQRTLIVEKENKFKIEIGEINYEADISIARNVYQVQNGEDITISPIVFFFNDWRREGVQYAKPSGNPVEAITGAERLTKIKESPFPLDKAIQGIYGPLGLALPSTDDFMKLFKNHEKTLYELVNPE